MDIYYIDDIDSDVAKWHDGGAATYKVNSFRATEAVQVARTAAEMGPLAPPAPATIYEHVKNVSEGLRLGSAQSVRERERGKLLVVF